MVDKNKNVLFEIQLNLQKISSAQEYGDLRLSRIEQTLDKMCTEQQQQRRDIDRLCIERIVDVDETQRIRHKLSKISKSRKNDFFAKKFAGNPKFLIYFLTGIFVFAGFLATKFEFLKTIFK